MLFGVRFKVVQVTKTSLITLFYEKKKKKEKPRSSIYCIKQIKNNRFYCISLSFSFLFFFFLFLSSGRESKTTKRIVFVHDVFNLVC